MNDTFYELLGFAAFVCIFVFAMVVELALKKRRDRYLAELASRHGFEYREGQQINLMRSFRSRLFRYSHTIKTEGVLAGHYKDHEISLFTKNFYSGRYAIFSRNRKFTLGSCEFGKAEFPHILLKSKNMPMYQYENEADRKVALEAPYLKDFDLYCPEDYEIEALQIFTEDLLVSIQKISRIFSIELGGNRVYVYIDKDIQNRKNEDDFARILKTIQEIIDKTDGLLHRLKDDFEVLDNYFKK